MAKTSEKLTTTIRVRTGERLKKQLERIAEILSAKLPEGQAALTSSDVSRMALHKFVEENTTSRN